MEEVEKKTEELLHAVSMLLTGEDGTLEYLVHQKIIAGLNRLKRGVKKNGVIN